MSPKERFQCGQSDVHSFYPRVASNNKKKLAEKYFHGPVEGFSFTAPIEREITKSQTQAQMHGTGARAKGSLLTRGSTQINCI